MKHKLSTYFLKILHKKKKKNNDINFKKKLHLRERGRRAETGKNAGSIAVDICQRIFWRNQTASKRSPDASITFLPSSSTKLLVESPQQPVVSNATS